MLLRAAFSLALILTLVLPTTVAAAGPWPEQASGTVIAVSEDFTGEGERGSTSIFIESGDRARFSIGLDSDLGQTDDDWSAYAFIRQPLTAPASADRVTVSAGVGAQGTPGGSEPLIVLGGAWGRDVQAGFAGWVSLEGAARYGATSGETELEGGATFGIEPIDRIALVNAFRVTGVAGSATDPQTELTSSIVGTLTDRTRIELGAVVDLSGNAPTGLRLGTWLEF